MGNIDRALTAKAGISLNDKTAIFTGALNPRTNSEVAPIGSTYHQEDGTVHVKFGAGNSDWRPVVAQLNNLSAVVDPTVNEDSGDGYSIGSFWINTATDQVFILVDATVAAASWINLTNGGGFPDDIDPGDWVLISGNDYRFDIVHNFNTLDVGVHIWDRITNNDVFVENINRFNTNTTRIFVKGNTHTLRVLVTTGTAGVANIDRFVTDVKASGGTFTWTGSGPYLVTIPYSTHNITFASGFEPIVQFRDDDGVFFNGVGPSNYKFNSSGDLLIEMPTPDDMYVSMR